MEAEQLDRNDTGTTPEGKNAGHGNLTPGGKKGLRRVSSILRDLRWVVKNPTADGTEFQKSLQKLLTEDPGKFVDRLMRAERDHTAGAEKATANGESAEAGSNTDLGLERGIALVEELLAKMATTDKS